MSDSTEKDPFEGFITESFIDGVAVEPPKSEEKVETPAREEPEPTPEEDVAEEEVAEASDDGEEANDGEEVDDEAAEVADDEAAEDDAQPKKSRRDKRIDNLVKLRRRAERETVAVRAELERLKAERAGKGNNDYKAKALQLMEKDPEAPKRPDPRNYDHGSVDTKFQDDYHEFRKAQDKYVETVAQSLEAEQTFADQQSARVVGLRARLDVAIEEGKSLFNDFDEVVVKGAAGKKWALTQHGAEFIAESDNGPLVAYHLAKNPKLAKEIADLSPTRQTLRLGKLEEELVARNVAEAAKPNVSGKKASAAPPPTKRVQGGRSTKEVSAETTDFAAFEKLMRNRGF